MRFLLTCCFISLLVLDCKAQLDSIHYKTDKDVMNKIQELRNKRAPIIVCYYVNCVGSWRVIDEKNNGCAPDEIKYLVWLDSKKPFIQRFDECNAHPPQIISVTFLNLIRINFDKIKKAKIEYPVHTEVIDGKKTELTTVVDHSCHYKFEIYTKGRVLRKSIDDYALDTKLVDDKYINKNYVKNQRSVLNKMIKLAKAEVIAYNKDIK